MNRNLVVSTYGRFCINFPQSRMKGEWHRLSPYLTLEIVKQMSKIQFTEMFCMYVFVWIKNPRWPPQQDKKENRTTWENLAYSLKPLNNLKSCWPHCFLGNSAKIQFFMVIEFQDDCNRRTYLCQWIYYWIINLLNTNSTWIIRWASSFIFSYFMKYIWFYSIFFSFRGQWRIL